MTCRNAITASILCPRFSFRSIQTHVSNATIVLYSHGWSPIAFEDIEPDRLLLQVSIICCFCFNDLTFYYSYWRLIISSCSNENLVKDTFLRRNMDNEGWVPVTLIAGFKKVSLVVLLPSLCFLFWFLIDVIYIELGMQFMDFLGYLVKVFI